PPPAVPGPENANRPEYLTAWNAYWNWTKTDAFKAPMLDLACSATISSRATISPPTCACRSGCWVSTPAARWRSDGDAEAAVTSPNARSRPGSLGQRVPAGRSVLRLEFHNRGAVIVPDPERGRRGGAVDEHPPDVGEPGQLVLRGRAGFRIGPHHAIAVLAAGPHVAVRIGRYIIGPRFRRRRHPLAERLAAGVEHPDPFGAILAEPQPRLRVDHAAARRRALGRRLPHRDRARFRVDSPDMLAPEDREVHVVLHI